MENDGVVTAEYSTSPDPDAVVEITPEEITPEIIPEAHESQKPDPRASGAEPDEAVPTGEPESQGPSGGANSRAESESPEVQGDFDAKKASVPPKDDNTVIIRETQLPTWLYIFPLYGWPPKDFYRKFTLGWGEVISGITVSLAQLPEAIAWPILAGVPVGVGLSASWVMALVTSLFGGRPGMVSGATGSTAVLMVNIVKNNQSPPERGQILLFYAVMFAGALQIIGFLVRAGKVLRLISTPVVYGFVNGLGLLIFFSQFASFKCPMLKYGDTLIQEVYIKDGCPGAPLEEAPKDLHEGGASHNPIAELGEGVWLSWLQIGLMMIHVVITMIITLVIPRFSSKWPAAMTGIAVAFAIEHLIFDLAADNPTIRIQDVGEPIVARFPIPIWAFDIYLDAEQQFSEASANETLSIFRLSGSEFGTIASLGFSIALVGSVESLLTEQLIDEITKTKSDASQEFLGQGLGNVISGLTGGMGGCAMIGQSMVNIDAGARTRLSTIVASLCTFIILMGASAIVNLIPLGALVGVMFVIVYKTIEWASLEMIFFSCMPMKWRDYLESLFFMPSHVKKINRGDVVVIVTVTVMTLVSDLGIAVGVGLILSTIFFSWESGDIMKIKSQTMEMTDYQARKPQDERHLVPVKIYEIDGPLCFASVPRFLESFDYAEEDPEYVEIHFHQSTLFGYSAVDALDKIGARYNELNKQLVLRRVKQTCKKNLAKATDLVGGGVLIHEEATEVWDNKVELLNYHCSMHRAQHGGTPPLATDHRASSKDTEASGPGSEARRGSKEVTERRRGSRGSHVRLEAGFSSPSRVSEGVPSSEQEVEQLV